MKHGTTISLKVLLRWISIASLALLLIVGALGIGALQRTAGASSAMGLGKDLVADILPPPLFIIEAQLVAYDIASAHNDQRTKLIDKLQQLHKDYDERNQFWSDAALPADIKSSLLGEQRHQADQFWKEVDEQFLPAIQNSDQARMENSLHQMREAYDAHRAGVENTVGVASKYAETTLTELTDASRSSSQLMLLAIAAGAAMLLLAMRHLRLYLSRSIGGEPTEAVAVVRQIADGQLDSPISVAPGCDGSMLAAMADMQHTLHMLISEIQATVRAAENGKLSNRLSLADKQGFGKEIAQALNQLMAVTDNSLNDIARVAGALAEGDLSKKVEQQYPGSFGRTSEAVNYTVASLAALISDVGKVVDSGRQGNLNARIDLHSKQGYGRTLSELINSLTETTHEALTDISGVTQCLADGDLTRKIERSYPGLYGDTANSLNLTVSNLRKLIGNVVLAADTISTTAQEIAIGNRDLSARTEQQASNLEETASSMEEFTTTAHNNTESAMGAMQLAVDATEIARRGGHVVRASADTMQDIEASSRQIQEIIGVIEGIAFQTNILALNAAVEAARAGDQGKGFAVVATEVRALAQRSANAAKEIAQLIAESGKKVGNGTRQAQQAGESMEQIIEAISRVSTIVVAISESTREQTSGIQQVNGAVSQMDSMTQQNTALVEQAAAAAESLEHEAHQLQLQINAFKLEKNPNQMPRMIPSNKTTVPKQIVLREELLIA